MFTVEIFRSTYTLDQIYDDDVQMGINSDIRLTEFSKNIRPPVVAGYFYPDDPAELRQMVSGMLEDATFVKNRLIPKGKSNYDSRYDY